MNDTLKSDESLASSVTDNNGQAMNVGQNSIVTAKHRFAPIAAQKVRALIKTMRWKNYGLNDVICQLEHMPNKSAAIVLKVLKSAIANAENNNNMDIDELRIIGMRADEAKTHKRIMPRASDRILKRTSHVTVEVGE